MDGNLSSTLLAILTVVQEAQLKTNSASYCNLALYIYGIVIVQDSYKHPDLSYHIMTFIFGARYNDGVVVIGNTLLPGMKD
jgi:hypothetical protein